MVWGPTVSGPEKNGRWPLTLANLVKRVFSLTLSNPVDCMPALPYLPTAVPIMFFQKKSNCVTCADPFSLSVKIWREFV